jgi:DNA-binding LytR/AlgR family response regulator
MDPMRILLVDDEPIARRVLKEELDQVPEVEVIGEADNGIRALEQIGALKPDLVFLDLQMPEMGGFEVVENLEGPCPVIVIVTAFDRHALQAFDAGAVDYLLKPVSQERLMRCLDKVQKLRTNHEAAAASVAKLRKIGGQTPPARPTRVVGKLREEYHLLDTNQVLAFQAERELVWIITSKQRYLATQPLKAVEEKLGGSNFARIHRNAVVNLNHIVKMTPLSSHRWLITLSNQQEFVVSKRQAQTVRKLLSW